MTPHQKRVEKTARAMYRWWIRRMGYYPWARGSEMYRHIARWHLRMGGRAPGETCGTCELFDTEQIGACLDCTHTATNNWRPNGGAK